MKRRFRALELVHPDFARGRQEMGLSADRTGRLRFVDDKASVRQALLILLTTLPGERVMRPQYGCYLSRLVYAPNDDTTAGLAMHYVREAITRWEPRVEILRLDATRSDPLATHAGGAQEDLGELHVILDYRVRPTQETDTLMYTLALFGERR